MPLRLPRDTQLSAIGSGLVRPESVLTHSSGLLFCSDWHGNGGIAVVTPTGVVHRIAVADTSLNLRPNGIALEAGGSFIIAHLGAEDGGAFRLYPDGSVDPVLLAIDGTPLPPSNFPIRDAAGRLWLTVSTRKSPRSEDYRATASSGFIAVQDKNSARIVADGLGYANELAFSADGQYLYINETFARRLTRYAIAADASLSEPTVIWRFGPGDYPDGVVLDAEGHLWITSIVSNRVIRIAPDGSRAEVIVEDSDQAHLDWAEAAYGTNTMGRPHLDGQPAKTLRNISSLAFGGTGLRRAYLGCLLGDGLFQFDTPVPGLKPLHYDLDISPLLETLDIA